MASAAVPTPVRQMYENHLATANWNIAYFEERLTWLSAWATDVAPRASLLTIHLVDERILARYSIFRTD